MISVSGNIWQEIRFNRQIFQKIKQDYKFSEVLSYLIAHRKFNKEEIYTIENYIDLINPFTKDKDFELAKELIIDFINLKKKILIIGDYDVDGSVATALLIKLFKQIEHPFDFYIPDRVEDGYGISNKLFKKIEKKLTELVIIVDSGSKSFDTINYLNKLNIKTIIIDHHELVKPYPKSNSFINPKKNKNNDHSNLCASALVYFLIDMIKQKISLKNYSKSDLFLTALATVCDVMPLRGLNRNIVQKAYKEYNHKNLDFINYFYLKKNKSNKFDYDDLGYLIGPILNSGGRLNKSNLATKLIISSNKNEIRKISNQLINLNKKRKEIENNSLSKINYKDLVIIKDKIIILKDLSIPEGLIGIIASRILEKYNKTTIVITQSGNLLKGSARSTSDINIGSIINNAVFNKIIINGGGHRMAAGFSLNNKNFDKFKDFISELKFNKLEINKQYVTKISTSAINRDFLKNLEKLAPYGNSNERPIFFIENLKIYKPEIINNSHINCLLKDKKNKTLNAISFYSVNTDLGNYILNYKKEISIFCKFKLYGVNNNKINTHILDIVI